MKPPTPPSKPPRRRPPILRTLLLAGTAPLWGTMLLGYGVIVGILGTLVDSGEFLVSWNNSETAFTSTARVAQTTDHPSQHPMRFVDRTLVGIVSLPFILTVSVLRGILLGPYRSYQSFFRRVLSWQNR